MNQNNSPPADFDGSLVKEVFAQFGLAYYMSQVLERGVAILYSFLFGGVHTPKEFDELLTSRFKDTLGEITLRLERAGAPAALIKDLRACLNLRNRLAHRYFWERAAAFVRPDGQLEMVEELGRFRDEFIRVDRAIDDWLRRILATRGFDLDAEVEKDLQVILEGHRDWRDPPDGGDSWSSIVDAGPA